MSRVEGVVRKGWIGFLVLVGLLLLTQAIMELAEPAMAESVKKHQGWLFIVAIAKAAPVVCLAGILISNEKVLSVLETEKNGFGEVLKRLEASSFVQMKILRNAKEFYEDLGACIQHPAIVSARLTAVRGVATHAPEYSGDYYAKVKERCKSTKDAFSIKRLIGVPNDEMIGFAEDNMKVAKELGPRFGVRVMPWSSPLSGFNMAVLDSASGPTTVYIVMTSGPALTDTVAIKFAENPEVAKEFSNLFDRLYEKGDEPTPEAINRIRTALKRAKAPL
jgi:hypothetical protein